MAVKENSTIVTGASGLLGSTILMEGRKSIPSLVGQYWEHPIHIVGTDSLRMDLRDVDSACETLRSFRPDVIIHCAAATNVDWCEDHVTEAHHLNAEVPGALAKTARNMGTRFVHISTDAVFDGKTGNYSETDLTGPVNEYAKSKLCAEHEVLSQNPDALVLRVNMYGWSAQRRSLAEWVLRELEAERPVPGFIDVWFCPILVNDLAEIILGLIQSGASGIYHAAGSERISKFEFARRVAAIFGHDPSKLNPTLLAEAKLRAARSPDMSLNTAKIAEKLRRSMPDVNSGLVRFRELRDNGFVRELRSYSGGIQV